MGLTDHLKEKGSPLRAYFQEQFPGVKAVVKDCQKQFAGCDTLRPEQTPPWSTIGMAIDYRLRYYFTDGSDAIHVAESGLASLDDQIKDAAYDLCHTFRRLLKELKPVGRRLNQADEDLLLRHCVVLGLFDMVYRIGASGAARSPLMMPKPRTTVEELLAIAEPYWLDDLRSLSWGFWDSFGHLTSLPAEINPTFEGSRDVGGADADLIVDGCLIDIKTTVCHTEARTLREAIHQLLGYVLLDYSDARRINGVGIYLARQQQLVRWPLDTLLPTLTGRGDVSLPELRARFQGCVKTLCADDPSPTP